ncbi:MAG: efflux RND transporter periplasmic adaptor subunit [Sphingomonas sp.]
MRAFIAVISLLLLSACGGGAADNGQTPVPTAQVRTAAAQLNSSINDTTVYGVTEAGPGSVRALAVPADAIIETIAAPTGTAVGAGQVVMTLRPSPMTRAAIAKAASDTAVAAAGYQRALRMRADGLMSNADVETARGALATASATRDNLGIKGGLAVLRAPGAGTVQGLSAKPGDQIAAGTTVATIGAPSGTRVRFGVDPTLAQRVHSGAPIRIEMMDGSHAATVRVVGVDPQIDPSTRLALVYARVPAGSDISPGEPLRGSLSVGGVSTGVSIPYAAVLDDGGRSYVFVIRNGVAKARDVSPGNSSGDNIQILKGLNVGDRVVVEGGTALEDGMKVSEQHTGAAK